jgi:hypothetical protein
VTWVGVVSIFVSALALAISFAAYIWAAREDGRYQDRVDRVQRRLNRSDLPRSRR